MKTMFYFNRSYDVPGAAGGGVRHASARRDARLALLAGLGSCALAGLGQAWGATLSVCSSCPYTTLQTAVTAANANADSSNTINVGAGTYSENAPFLINSTRAGIANKTLIINGVSAQSTLIKAGPTLDLTDTGWWDIDSGETLNLSNLTLDGNYPGGARLSAGLVFAGNGTLDRVSLTNICRDVTLDSGKTLRLGSGIVQDFDTTANMTLTVQNSRIDNFCETAIQIDAGNASLGSGSAPRYSSSVNLLNNAITCAGQPPTSNTLWVQTGISVWGGAKATLTGNTIANCYGVIDCANEPDYYLCPAGQSPAPVYESSGLLVRSSYAAGTGVTAKNNLLVDNYDGILLEFYDYSRGAWVFNSNSLPKGTAPNGLPELGLLYFSEMSAGSNARVDAKNNWWGQATTPKGSTWENGLIRHYERVDYDPLYDPWITAYVGDGTKYGQPGFWPILPGDAKYPATTCNKTTLNLTNLSFPASVGAFSFASNTSISTSGNVIVEANADLSLRAPRHGFQPGFRVIKGAYLKVVAGAGGC